MLYNMSMKKKTMNQYFTDIIIGLNVIKIASSTIDLKEIILYMLNNLLPTH